MLYANLGTLSLFAGTPCEGGDGIREESRDYRGVHPVRDPSRKQRRRREKPPSPRKAWLRAHLGTSSMGFETPNEQRTTPTVKPRRPRRHPLGLQLFSLDELAPCPTMATF
jgi:hypothetical protein